MFAYLKGKVLGPRKELPYLKAHEFYGGSHPAQILSDETDGLTLASSGYG